MFHQGFHVSRCTLDTALSVFLRLRGLSPSPAGTPNLPGITESIMYSNSAVRTTVWLLFPFARRYSGNRCFFLFLRLLRMFQFTAPFHTLWIGVWMTGVLPARVSPFRHLRIKDYLHLPAAFRSLSRLSSALSAKASTLRSFFLLGLFNPRYFIALITFA